MLVANAFDIAVWSCSNAPGRSAAAERSPHVLSAPPFSLTFSCAGNCSYRTPNSTPSS